jgi:outer membrane protein assembly factor BamA
LKTNYYHRGYPDTGVEVKRLKEELQGDLLQLDLLMSIRTGNKIQLGKVKFEEEKKAKVSLLQGRVRLQEGSLLDRIKVEQGRYRLAQLGIFESVDLRYEPQDEHTRDVIYRVKETKTTELSLLFGFGSYELLRGGVELERRDLFGLAHDARLKLVQSFKASSGEFYYTVPELVGRDVDLFVNGTALRRQEVSFLREEYGGGAGAHKFYKDLASDLSVRYNYQILNAAQVDGIIATEGVRNPTVGAIVADLKHDRRDNPLYPHSGYRIFLTVESATQYLGGDVNYERADLSTSYHQPLGGGRWLHFGLSHGVAYALGSSSNNLPFTRRFFPGGQNSIRGYEEGRASSRDEQGRFVGAATYALGSVEFEQALTPKWSLVLFSDSLGEARRIEHYPFDTGLFSIGLGLSWRTIIGPVRLEYGHNLNPRQGDPSGTVQFSFGFPF